MTTRLNAIFRVFSRLVFGLVCLPAVVRAQRVAGTVRDSASSAPLPGAVVVLMDSVRHVHGRTLSDANGRYALVRGASDVRLRVIRIGFVPREVALVDGTQGAHLFDVTMAHSPIILPPLEVAGTALCSERPDRKRAAALWEQARAGLLAAVVAREARPASASLLTYTRSEALADGHVLQQDSRVAIGSTTRPFLTVETPRHLAERGYAEEGPVGRVFNAPDADVLLDDSFAETHCFELADDARQPGSVGLAFTPARGRDSLVDVRGVLWMDTAVPRVRSLVFRFTQLEPAAMRAGAGGELHFHTMENGVTFISSWQMVLPVVREAQRYRMSARTVVQLREVGGTVLTARWDDSVVYRGSLPHLVGRVLLERGSTPADGVVLTIAGTRDTVRSDADGRFRFPELVPGRYQLVASDTAFAAYGYSRDVTMLVTVPQAPGEGVVVDVPSRVTVMSRVCDGQRVVDRSTIIFGTLVADALFDFRGLSVGWDWTGERTSAAGRRPADDGSRLVGVSPRGRFRICGVPAERAVTLTLRRDGRPIGDTVVVSPPGNRALVLPWAFTRTSPPHR